MKNVIKLKSGWALNFSKIVMVGSLEKGSRSDYFKVWFDGLKSSFTFDNEEDPYEDFIDTWMEVVNGEQKDIDLEITYD